MGAESLLKSGVDLERAIDAAVTILKPIGTYVSVIDIWRTRSTSKSKGLLSEPEDVRKTHLATIQDLVAKYSVIAAPGQYEQPFDLAITRPGVDWKGRMQYDPGETEESRVEKPKDFGPLTNDLFEKFFPLGDWMGIGDEDEALALKIFGGPPPVWRTKMFDVSEIEVSPEIYKDIEDHWATHFFPKQVTARLWKMWVNAAGGFVEGSRDVAQPGLVGNCLWGLGDYTWSAETTWRGSEGCILIGQAGESLRPTVGTYVSFYPDTRCSMAPATSGYRACFGFKIYAKSDSTDAGANASADAGYTPEIEQDVIALSRLLAQIPGPYGIVLSHQYSLDTSHFSGVDSILIAAARRAEGVDFHVIPIVTRLTAQSSMELSEDGETIYSEQATAPVVPFTRKHVETVLEQSFDSDEEREEGGGGLLVEESSVESALNKLRDVPFYTLETSETSSELTSFKMDRSMPDMGLAVPINSVFLVYALIIIPRSGPSS